MQFIFQYQAEILYFKFSLKYDMSIKTYDLISVCSYMDISVLATNNTDVKYRLYVSYFTVQRENVLRFMLLLHL